MTSPRLWVEQLEARDCPALIVQQPAVLSDSLLSLSAQVLPGQQVQLSGTVTGAEAAGATIDFKGAAVGSTTADADGDFSFTTTGASLGTVSAVALDSQQDTLGTAGATIAVAAPVVTLNLTYVTPAGPVSDIDAVGETVASQQMVTLSGSVSDIDAAGETVTFTGLVAGSTVTDANGNFSYTANVTSTGAIDAATTDLWGQASNTAEVDVAPPPTVTLNTQVLPGHEVQLTGTVSGANAAGATVEFSGAVAGSTSADANGNFSFTTTSASLGTVSAVAVEAQQNTSNPVSATVSESAPTITLAVTSVGATSMTLSGTVTDVDEVGETVNITGAVNGSVTTDANGNFSFTMATSNLGTVEVSTTDLWGETSNTAEVPANALPPVIEGFTAIAGSGNSWILEGTVVGPNPQGLVVTFNGIPALAGLTATVASDGSFYLVVNLSANDFGTVTAQTTDQLGQNSNVASAVID